jgi:hypothetical protein
MIIPDETCKELKKPAWMLTAGWRADRIAPFIGG